MATTRSYFIPGWGYINEVKGNAYFVPGWGYVNETVSAGSTFKPAWAARSNLTNKGYPR